jgi:hypothetical protein
MIGAERGDPYQFEIEEEFFGGYDCTAMKYRITVEADSAEQARERIDAVGYLVGIEKASVLLVVSLDRAILGMPLFMKSYFCSVTPGSLGPREPKVKITLL